MSIFRLPLLTQAAPAAPQGLFDHAFDIFHRGGPVMWPILFCSLLGLTVAIERMLAFWKYNTANFFFRKNQSTLIALTREGKFEEAIRSAKTAESPICRILVKALENRDAGFQETLEAASQLELNRLRRGLSLLDTTITVAPMLGILGTVTGIINTFNLLSSAGIEDPSKATAGLAEALITTAAGLIVAIGCLFPFNYLVSQIKHRTTELEQVTHQFELAYNTSINRTARASSDRASEDARPSVLATAPAGEAPPSHTRSNPS